MTRKFVYDPHVERVQMVASGVHEGAHRSRPLRWLLVAAVLAASAMAFDAAQAIAQARGHVSSAH